MLRGRAAASKRLSYPRDRAAAENSSVTPMSSPAPSGLTWQDPTHDVEQEVGPMPQTIVLVGTRKGCFVLDSDGDRRDWKVRGPYCEGWPVYHAVYDADSGAIYAA